MIKTTTPTILSAMNTLEQDNLLTATDAGHLETSSKYQAVDTKDLLARLADEMGTYDLSCEVWRPKSSKNTTHMVTVRAPQPVQLPDGTTAVPTLTVRNSYGGESSIRIIAGTYRLVCSNGMYAGVIDHQDSAVHYPGPVRQILDRLPLVAASFEQSAEQFHHLAHALALVELTYSDVVRLAQQLLPKRTANKVIELWMRPQVRREADRGETLWNLYNIMNEQDRIAAGSRPGAYLQRQLQLGETLAEYAHNAAA